MDMTFRMIILLLWYEMVWNISLQTSWLGGKGKGQNVTSNRLALRMGISATLMDSLSGSLLLSTDWFLEEVDVR